MSAIVIGIVGAESTGKTALAGELVKALQRGAETSPTDARVAWVGEHLREFCEVHGRTPRQEEQQGIADEQTRRIATAAASHDIVIADTTAVMIAVYSDIVFGDRSLYPEAEHAHRRCTLTLLAALDLPWKEDGLMRDGPHVREPVDALVRASLDRAGAPYAVIGGQGPARLDNALRAVRQALTRSNAPRWQSHDATRWTAVCATCGNADCERRLFSAHVDAPTGR